MFDGNGERPPDSRADLDYGAPMDTGGVTPDADELYRALSSGERRRLLYFLLDRSNAGVDEVSDALAGWRSRTGGVVGPADRDRIATRLRHVHLPMLRSAGLVTYDPASEALGLPALADPVVRSIEFAREYDRATRSDR